MQYSYTEMDVVGGNPRGDYRVDKLLVPEWVDQVVLRNWASALNVITFRKEGEPESTSNGATAVVRKNTI